MRISEKHRSSRRFALTGLSLAACALLSGCSSTKVSDREQFVTGSMPRPKVVWVHAFAATPADLHNNSVLAPHVGAHDEPQTIEHITEGRTLSHELAGELTHEIQKLGMPGALATSSSVPNIGDLLVVGSIVSFDEGSTVKRLAIGFGAGKSSVCVVAETFVVTPSGLLPVGTGTIDAGSKKTPGVALGLGVFIASSNPAGLILSSATKVYGEVSGGSRVEGRTKAASKEIADALEVRFKEQGWIQ